MINFLYKILLTFNLTDINDRKFSIKDEERLKHLLWGIEERYYTTRVGGEKRVANSVSKIENNANA